MADPRQTILVVINHFLQSHPELAPQVEILAAQQQGKTVEDIINFNEWKKYQGLSTQEIFTKIYEENTWGKSPDPSKKYYSGSGSHRRDVTNAYVDAIKSVFSSTDKQLTALDLGCGDFNIGSQLRGLFKTYIACDIVQPVIEFNKEHYKELDVDFRTLDFTTDPIPPSDVIFIRQVLQHLSNVQIQRALKKVKASCRYLVVTEHLPSAENFQPNLDKPHGGGIRLGFASGIVLTADPFHLNPIAEQILCEAPEAGGVIRTILYTLR